MSDPGSNGDSQQRGNFYERHWGDSYSLIRQTHIFASITRDVLETKYLSQVSPFALTLSQFHLLKLISLNGNHQVGEVAEFLGISGPAATKNIDKLERLGLVERTPSTGDRRATLLSSSPAGRRLVERYESHKRNQLEPVLEKFTREELHNLTRLLQRFSMALVQREDEGDGLCLRCAAYFEESCPVSHVRGDCAYQRVHQSRVARPAAGGSV